MAEIGAHELSGEVDVLLAVGRRKSRSVTADDLRRADFALERPRAEDVSLVCLFDIVEG